MKKIRVAVIGGGHLGRIHARLLKNNPIARLSLVCDPQPLVQQAFIKDFNVRAVSDFRKSLDEFDAAVIATPTGLHADIARALILQGKHLLIEKPVTAESKDAHELARLAREKSLCVQVGQVERFNPAIQAAQSVVGTPKYIEASRQSGYTFRSTDIGVVQDLMIHDIDLVCQMFSGPLQSVHALGISMFGEHEDIAQARLEFACGGVANLTASRCSFQPERIVKIFGTKGYASADLTQHRVTSVQVPHWIAQREFDFSAVSDDQKQYIREHLFSQVLPKSELEVAPVNAIEAEQTDWLESIGQFRDPIVTIEQGARNVEIAEEIIGQINAHRWSSKNRAQVGPLAIPAQRDMNRQRIPAILQNDSAKKAA
ncbi:MAG: Gfo/Idh/MocA family oxidoreductase [Pirellulaceae bacterium]|nr:Gfo/Idh/MocA family oxidoreductase [Pirellulaceae bacterium]